MYALSEAGWSVIRLSKALTASNLPTKLHVIRIVAGTTYGSHTNPLFFNFKVLKIEQLRLFQVCEFIYKYDRGLLPPVYKGFFNLASDSVISINCNCY